MDADPGQFSTPIDTGELLASAEHLLAEARAAALGLGEEAAWIERLVIATETPETTASRKDALGDLQRMIANAGSDAGLQAQLASDLGDLIRKLPHDIRADAEDAVLKAAIDGDTASLIAQAGGYLNARLRQRRCSHAYPTARSASIRPLH